MFQFFEPVNKGILSPQEMGQFYETMKNTVVYVRSRYLVDGITKYSEGCGVFTDPNGVILTVAHLLVKIDVTPYRGEGQYDIQVRVYGQEAYLPLIIEDFKQDTDLATLRLLQTLDNIACADVDAKAPLDFGTEVVIICYSQNLPYSIFLGFVSYVDRKLSEILTENDAEYNRYNAHLFFTQLSDLHSRECRWSTRV